MNHHKIFREDALEFNFIIWVYLILSTKLKMKHLILIYL